MKKRMKKKELSWKGNIETVKYSRPIASCCDQRNSTSKHNIDWGQALALGILFICVKLY